MMHINAYSTYCTVMYNNSNELVILKYLQVLHPERRLPLHRLVHLVICFHLQVQYCHVFEDKVIYIYYLYDV